MTADKFHDALTLLPADLIEETDKLRRRKPKTIPLRRFAAMAASLALVLFCGALLTGRILPRMSKSTETAAAQMEAAPAAPDMAETQCASAIESPAESLAGAAQASGNTRAEATSEEVLPEHGWDTKNDPGDISPILCQSYNTPENPLSSVNIYSIPKNLLVTTRAELDAYIEDHSHIYDFTDLTAALPAYDDAWFEENDLLLTVVHAAHTGEAWTVTAIKNAQSLNDKDHDWYILVSNAGESLPDNPQTTCHLLTPIEKNRISPTDTILTIHDTSSIE